MKKRYFFLALLLVFALELAALLHFALQSPKTLWDTVAVNEVVQSLAKAFDTLDTYQNPTQLHFVAIDADGRVRYKTDEGLSESIYTATKHCDMMLDITRDGAVLGKVIIQNDSAKQWQAQKQRLLLTLSLGMMATLAVCTCYAIYLHARIVKPFRALECFASRVAKGNLDIPLAMDRGHLFGAFTESFDLMRTELKKARLAEAAARADKKELVAKLSHDIKTPVASIKAVAEVGYATTLHEKTKASYRQIIQKTDQINALVTNLFTATLEEMTALSVTPTATDSTLVRAMLENADYLHRATLPHIPECLLLADAQRLQQVFDNIFANSYKYAGTAISVEAELQKETLCLVIEDFGGGVGEEEVAHLKEKFKRGANAAHIEGAGLGLFIADCLMREMKGACRVENGTHGLKVTLDIALFTRL